MYTHDSYKINIHIFFIFGCFRHLLDLSIGRPGTEVSEWLYEVHGTVPGELYFIIQFLMYIISCMTIVLFTM